MPVEVKILNTKMKDQQGYLYDMDLYVGNVSKTIPQVSEEESDDSNENDGE